ncbi:MAG TPA: N-acetylglucosamine-6-phosphate deacetylase [Ktedonobacterales bacterium]|nr:N-acetylglucosamine-6-phosphate deacetylase [Ktedonobacterales bacterium]
MADRGPEETGTPIQILAAQTVYAPEELSGSACVVVEGTRIRDIWPATTAIEARERIARLLPDVSVAISDLGAARLAPGFIDLHIHGFHGYDVNSGSAVDIREMARRLPAGGTTAFYPTIATTNRQHTLDCVSSIAEATQHTSDEPMAEIAGIRLEGPFISPAKKGAQYGADIRRPDPVELRELVDAGQGLVRFVDFAPEEDGAERLLASAVRLGLIPCVGHTNATFEQTIQALDGGTRHSTHLFNAMSPLKHQAPGVPGALLTDERATVEIIADGVHLAPATLRLVLRARSPRDVALVTDAMPAAGLPDGEYDFLHRKVIVRERAARLANGSLAGSTLTLDLAVRNMVDSANVAWATAIEMATLTPARIAGIDARKGRLAPGYDADIVALDVDGRVLRAWTRGTLAYSREHAIESMP